MWFIIFLLPLASCILPIIMFMTDPSNKKWPVIPYEVKKKLVEQTLENAQKETIEKKH